MRARCAWLFVSVFVACSDDTFAPAEGGPGGIGGAGLGGASAAGRGGVSSGGGAGAETAGRAGQPAGAAGNGEAGMAASSASAGSSGNAAGSGGGAAEGGAGGGASGGAPGGGAGNGSSANGGAANGGAANGGAANGGAANGGAGASGQAGADACAAPPPGPTHAVGTCGNDKIEGDEQCDGSDTAPGNDCVNCLACPLAPRGRRIGTRCYILDPTPHSHGQVYSENPGIRAKWATDLCRDQMFRTTHLAQLSTAAEQAFLPPDFLKGFTPGEQSVGPWLAGGFLRGAGGNQLQKAFWFWSEGPRIEESQWGPGLPAVDEMAPTRYCAVLNGGGFIANGECFDGKSAVAQRPVLCEREPSCVIGKDKETVVGYLTPSGRCYAAVPGAVDFQAAAKACATRGAHLASFETIEELVEMEGYGADLTTNDAWVGAVRKLDCANDAFLWTTNGVKVPDVTTIWSTAQPGVTGGRCATMGRDRRLTRAFCDTAHATLCERNETTL